MYRLMPTNKRFIRPYDKPSFEYIQRFGINWRHPLTRNFIGCLVFNGGAGLPIDLVTTNRIVTNTGGVWDSTYRGIGFKLDGQSSNDNLVLTDTANDFSPPSGTVEVWYIPRTISASGYHYFGITKKDSDWNANRGWHWNVESTVSDMYFVGSGSAYPLVTVTWSVNNIYQFVAKWSGTTVTLYQNGAQIGTGSIDSILAGDGSLQLSYYDYLNAGGDGSFISWRMWDRDLKAWEIENLYFDPDDMFRHPSRPKYYFVPAAPPVGNAPTGVIYGPLVGPMGGPI